MSETSGINVKVKMDSILKKLDEKGLSLTYDEAKSLGIQGVLERVIKAYQ